MRVLAVFALLAAVAVAIPAPVAEPRRPRSGTPEGWIDRPYLEPRGANTATPTTAAATPDQTIAGTPVQPAQRPGAQQQQQQQQQHQQAQQAQPVQASTAAEAASASTLAHNANIIMNWFEQNNERMVPTLDATINELLRAKSALYQLITASGGITSDSAAVLARIIQASGAAKDAQVAMANTSKICQAADLVRHWRIQNQVVDRIAKTPGFDAMWEVEQTRIALKEAAEAVSRIPEPAVLQPLPPNLDDVSSEKSGVLDVARLEELLREQLRLSNLANDVSVSVDRQSAAGFFTLNCTVVNVLTAAVSINADSLTALRVKVHPANPRPGQANAVSPTFTSLVNPILHACDAFLSNSSLKSETRIVRFVEWLSSYRTLFYEPCSQCNRHIALNIGLASLSPQLGPSLPTVRTFSPQMDPSHVPKAFHIQCQPVSA
ncbi:hypothetical protein GQ42DRAFT_170635 [Ramicandelaber brevisporus]|nr:hypothetical protein GQ42DRAFT_170635 [Ramicandelaber brevisporus]